MSQTHAETASVRPVGSGRGNWLTRYVREIISELRKVLWPSRKELITYTIVVIVFVVIMVAMVAGLDVGFAKLVLELFG